MVAREVMGPVASGRPARRGSRWFDPITIRHNTDGWSSFAPPNRLDAIDHNLQLLEDAPRAVDEVAPSRGRSHAAIGSLEEPDAELILEMPDPAAEIGLLQCERVRRLAEVAMVCRRFGTA